MEISFSMDRHNYSIIDFLIIGGGIAGLSVLNRLVDLEQKPVLIEALDYPSHKVCGEFLSPEAFPYLKDWEIIPECSIPHVKYVADHLKFEWTFPKASFGISRYELDMQLASRAKKKGAVVMSNTRVQELKKIENDLYALKLSTGNTLIAKNVFIGGGRFFNQEKNMKSLKMPYIGFKAHFSGLDTQNCLEMHLMPGAYLGISSVAKDVVNVACLAKNPQNITDPSIAIDALLNLPHFKQVKKKLDGGKMLFDKWLFTEAPFFGVKSNPLLKNVYFIGDAAGTIAPATGNGLAMAVTSGFMAADYALRQDYIGFAKAWKKRYAKRIQTGHLLHKTMMSPILSKIAYFICKNAPSTVKMAYALTREK